MKRNEVVTLFESLSHSQGFYGRLLRSIAETTEENRVQFFKQFEDCTDALDVIMLVEG